MNLPVPSVFKRVRFNFTTALLLALVFGCFACPTVKAAPGRFEQRAFISASQLHQDGLMPKAEKAFMDFLVRYPESELRAEGVLRLGQIRFNIGNLADALDSMRVEEIRAGDLADQYRFLAGECLLAMDRPRDAAAAFAGLLGAFPGSMLRLDAIYRQAVALGRIGDWSAVSKLLLAPESEFAKARVSRAGDPSVISGVLLAAEAAMELRDVKVVGELLASVPGTGLRAIDQWRGDLLKARVAVAENRLTEAVGSASNLVAVARQLRSPEALGQSLLFQADLLRQASLFAPATAALEEVLALPSGQSQRRTALSRIIDLTLKQGRLDLAVARLNRFLGSTNAEPAADAARIALAEIQVRQAYTVAPTNAAEAATLRGTAWTNLQVATAGDPSLPLLGRAMLSRGWVLLADSDYGGAATNFQGALRVLQPGRDAAVAAFKLGDSLMAQQLWADALTAYERVINQFGTIPEVRSNLLDHAFYQALKAAVAATNLASAEASFRHLSQSFPASIFVEPGALLLGQTQTRNGRLVEARATLTAFARQFKDSGLNDKAELLAARTFEKQRDWASVASSLNTWVAKYPTSPLRPTAEFLLADSTFRSGGETNAFALFTNLMARFPASDESPLARNWIANHYWSKGQHAAALEQFQLLYQSTNCPVDLANDARLMAGKSAFALQLFRDARSQFAELINVLPQDTNNPPVLLGQAYFGLGDTIFEQFMASTNKALDDFSEAVVALSKVGRYFALSPIGPAALGRLGELHLQWARLKADAKGFDAAINAFTMARDSAAADPMVRWRAQYAIGEVLEAQGRVDAALDAYLAVVYGSAERGPDPLTLKLAGIAAGRILEAQSKQSEAARIYARLAELEPAIRPAVERRVDALRSRFMPP